ncbi:uncharacterized protein LOC143298565 [Babylonia areolata]|uniref:uncharacterized protein LOC143298565 n=1 Tax=Babylonia areolata TaxID=304850 RepID=UPI003FD0F7F4
MKQGSGARGAGGSKVGGSPSSRASDAAERSPAVYFANLKADMLLQKQMQVLKRAERSLVHRIVIDQKILFRRFQAKLRRSKLARARLWGDKDTERQLRARDLHVMNTNCGQEEDDLEFLKKLKHQPCLQADRTGGKEGGMGRRRGRSSQVTDGDMEELIRAVMDGQDLPPTETTLHSLTALGHLLEETGLAPSAGPDTGRRETKPADRGTRPGPNVSVRPVTTHAHRTNPAEEATPEEAHSKRRVHTVKRGDQHLPRGKTETLNRSTASQTTEAPHISDVHKRRPRPFTSPACSQPQPKPTTALPKTPRRVPCVGRGESTQGSLLALGTSSPGLTSRRPSQTATSMFEEQKKVDLVALRLEEARNFDFTPRVSAFIQTLLDLDRKERTSALRTDTPAGEPSEGPVEPGEDLPPEAEREEREEEEKEWKEELKGDRKFDYYATKMALYAASVKKAPPMVLPGTPEEDNMKLVGDQNVRSITMRTLRMDPHPPVTQGEWEGGCGGDSDHDKQLCQGTVNILTL